MSGRLRAGVAGTLLSLLVAASGAAGAAPLDETLYARILTRYTSEVSDPARTRVAYRALADSEDWKKLVANVEQTDPDALTGHRERLSYWINVYNILAIDVVVRHYPVDSIRDIGSLLRPVWKRPAGTIAGRRVDLDEIEHEIMRPMGDPRIHSAIV